MTGNYWAYYNGKVKAGEYNNSNYFSIERRKKMEESRKWREEYNKAKKEGRLGEYYKKIWEDKKRKRKEMLDNIIIYGDD